MSYQIVETSEGKYRLREKFLFFKWWVTFGDGCGNDTGMPVEFDTSEEVYLWYLSSRGSYGWLPFKRNK